MKKWKIFVGYLFLNVVFYVQVGCIWTHSGKGCWSGFPVLELISNVGSHALLGFWSFFAGISTSSSVWDIFVIELGLIGGIDYLMMLVGTILSGSIFFLINKVVGETEEMERPLPQKIIQYVVPWILAIVIVSLVMYGFGYWFSPSAIE